MTKGVPRSYYPHQATRVHHNSLSSVTHQVQGAPLSSGQAASAADLVRSAAKLQRGGQEA